MTSSTCTPHIQAIEPKTPLVVPIGKHLGFGLSGLHERATVHVQARTSSQSWERGLSQRGAAQRAKDVLKLLGITKGAELSRLRR